MTAFWDQRYARADYLFGVAPNAFLARQAPRLKAGGRTLAIADGEGRNGVWLAEQGLAVHAVDSSTVAQEKARRLAAARGVELELELVDLATWSWPVAAYDVVVGIFIQFLPPDQRTAMFAHIAKALKPGGLLLLEGYRPKQVEYGTGGPSQPDNLYTEELLRAAFADFTIVELTSYDAEIAEGSAHCGLSALIDLVAVKPAT
jgi:cyclopropane fatty-acyl-phospholipid synthase-like methyltransferase